MDSQNNLNAAVSLNNVPGQQRNKCADVICKLCRKSHFSRHSQKIILGQMLLHTFHLAKLKRLIKSSVLALKYKTKKVRLSHITVMKHYPIKKQLLNL